MTDTVVLKIKKLEAAQRQLRTAIDLWFNDGDPVSIHALAYAAYEVVHVISKKRNKYRRDLLFDTLNIKDEYRADYARWIKKEANFFKHANREEPDEIEFRPIITELYFMFTILGLEICGEAKSAEESAFMTWLQFHKPNLLTEHGRETLKKAVSADDIEHMRTRPKRELFDAVKQARIMLGKD